MIECVIEVAIRKYLQEVCDTHKAAISLIDFAAYFLYIGNI